MNINKLILPIKDRCKKHDEQLYKTESSKPFCLDCQKEIYKSIWDLTSFFEAEDTGKYSSPIQITEILGFYKNSVISDLTIEEAEFTNFYAETEKEIEVFDIAVDRSERILQGKKFNLVFTGSAGLGKSHLAMSILKDLNNHEVPELYQKTMFAGVSEILAEVRHSFDNRSAKYNEYSMTKLLSVPDVLVLDDLGSETGSITTTKQASDFTQRVLYNVLNARQGKCTIVTTNYSGKQLKHVYDNKLLSRLLYNAKGNVINFDGIKDKRISEIEML